MRSLLRVAILILGTGCASPTEHRADLLVTNARVVTGSGAVIPNGSIWIREGRIAAVTEGNATGTAAQVIDAAGRTVLPGLIDTHRHILPWSFARSEADLQSYMETELPAVLEGVLGAGLTTVMSPADFVPEIFEVRRRLSEGDLRGPRLITAGRAFTGPGGHPAGSLCDGNPFCRSRCAVEVDDANLVRTEVKKDVEMGADFIKVVIDRHIVPNTAIDDAVVEAIASESEALGVPLLVHAGTEDMVMAVEMGADGLVHSPLESVEESGVAALLVQRGVPIATSVSWHTPEFASATGQPWNEDKYRQLLDNIRYLVDNGVVVAFGTDNPPPLGLTEFMYEVEALGTVLSPREVIESMTIQAARFLGIEDRLGTLEPGKVADLVLVDGDPLEDLAALGNVVMVVKEGTIVVDNR
jgi:imidazolonepropionase-like amidohydrolase